MFVFFWVTDCLSYFFVQTPGCAVYIFHKPRKWSGTSTIQRLGQFRAKMLWRRHLHAPQNEGLRKHVLGSRPAIAQLLPTHWFPLLVCNKRRYTVNFGHGFVWDDESPTIRCSSIMGFLKKTIPSFLSQGVPSKRTPPFKTGHRFSFFETPLSQTNQTSKIQKTALKKLQQTIYKKQKKEKHQEKTNKPTNQICMFFSFKTQTKHVFFMKKTNPTCFF